MTRRPPQPARPKAQPAGLGYRIGLVALFFALLANVARDFGLFLRPGGFAGPSLTLPLLLAAAALIPVGILWCACNLLWGSGFGDAGLVRGGVLGLKRLGWAALVCAALYLLRSVGRG
ncbi:MAG TPA: hypothetical protein VM490_05775 [Armatimonadaceae bacterium]|nr:hypothetical protein [Armatimonadaceae bacterium]